MVTPSRILNCLHLEMLSALNVVLYVHILFSDRHYGLDPSISNLSVRVKLATQVG
jgi:hypothetical protein